MRALPLAFGALVAFMVPASTQSQEDPPSADRLQEERLKAAKEEYFRMKSEDRSPDLWYGTPGVRPGGDLLGPVVELIRRPSGLLDFKPRKVESWLPDRETAEFLRERR